MRACSCGREIAWTPMGTRPGSPGTWMHVRPVSAEDCTGCPETGVTGAPPPVGEWGFVFPVPDEQLIAGGSA